MLPFIVVTVTFIFQFPLAGALPVKFTVAFFVFFPLMLSVKGNPFFSTVIPVILSLTEVILTCTILPKISSPPDIP